MKYLIASDIHGSAFYTKRLLEILDGEKADKLVVLGDIYNHGPRNPFPLEYEPLKVSSLLNSILDRLIVIKGNCDSEVDTLISDFDFISDMCITSNDKTVFLTHGHVYNKDNMPKTDFDCVIYGHFHTGFIERKGNTVIANPGSVSLPKSDTHSSYLILENGLLILKDINGKLIKQEKI